MHTPGDQRVYSVILMLQHWYVNNVIIMFFVQSTVIELYVQQQHIHDTIQMYTVMDI